MYVPSQNSPSYQSIISGNPEAAPANASTYCVP